jgi:hypothetical protein
MNNKQVLHTCRGPLKTSAVPDRPQYAVSRHQVCVEILNRYGNYIELRSLLAEPFMFHQFYVVPGLNCGVPRLDIFLNR